jgi:hypothetical protein
MVALSTLYTRIEAPVVTPHPFGLFSVAPPVNPSDTYWQTGVQWESWACIDPNTTTDQCINGGSVPAAKEFENCPNTDEFKPITLYMGIKRTGQSLDVGAKQAATVLQDAAEYAVEKYLWGLLNAAVTEATATSPVTALGNVEALLGVNYHGTGVIHMDRATAIRLTPQLVRNGDRMETAIGTPVAVGAGYYAAGAPAIYGTGALVMRRSQPSTDVAWNIAINDELVLIEQTYVVGWDCYVTGALVTPAT